MPTPTKGARLGGSPAHQKMILSNLATSLFEHGRITTTEAKARRLRPFAERLITKAKRGDLHARRQVLAVIRDKGVVHELFTEIGPRYATRPGGYTRITKLGPRKGDNAPMAVIELVEGREFAAVTQRTRPAAGSVPAVAPAAVASPTASDDTAGEAEGTVPAPDADTTAAADDTEAPVDGDIREEEVPTVAGDGSTPAGADEGGEAGSTSAGADESGDDGSTSA